MQRSHVQREAAVLGYPCPTCHREPGYRCHNLSNRAVRAHLHRLELALADAEITGRCSARSPDGVHLCELPDLVSWHHRGHHAFPRPLTSTSWGTSDLSSLR